MYVCASPAWARGDAEADSRYVTYPSPPWSPQRDMEAARGEKEKKKVYMSCVQSRWIT